jgi:hypothetical protein
MSSRRHFITSLMGTFGAVGIMLSVPSRAHACLYGTFKVRCPNGHIDTVEDGTCNHTCEKCGVKALSEGEGDILCPNGHINHVRTGSSRRRRDVTSSYKCRTCGKECRQD